MFRGVGQAFEGNAKELTNERSTFPSLQRCKLLATRRRRRYFLNA